MKLARVTGLCLLALAACHQQPAKTPDSSLAKGLAQAEPTPEPMPAPAPGAQIALYAGRLVLPAVPGHPAAAYFTLGNAGTTPVRIVGVAVAGAEKAEMHETRGTTMMPLPHLDLAPGARAAFAPGNRHVMVFGLPTTVKPGDSVAITVTTYNGKPVTGQLSAEAAGGEAGGGTAAGHADHMKM